MSMFQIPGSAFPFLQNLVTSNMIRSTLVSMAAGRVVAQYAPLPPREIQYYKGFFIDTQGELLMAYTSSLFDAVPVNFEAIGDYAAKFYEIRARNALGCCALSNTGSNGVYNMFHIGDVLSQEEIDMIAGSNLEFSGMVLGFEKVYKAIEENYLAEKAQLGT